MQFSVKQIPTTAKIGKCFGTVKSYKNRFNIKFRMFPQISRDTEKKIAGKEIKLKST